jgi:acyl carrier protein
MATIAEAVRAYIVDNYLLGAASEDLADDTSFLARGILDSTGILELVAFLEERFDLKIPDEDLLPENLDSLNAIAAYVERRRAS